MKYLLLTFIMVIFSYQSFSQSANTNKLRVSEVHILPGILVERIHNSTIADFKALAPQSHFLNMDLTGYNHSYGFYTDANSTFSVLLGFQFKQREGTGYKPNPVLRLGFTYFSSNSINNYYHKEVRKPADTLTSAQTGQVVYVDSVSFNSLNMHYSSEHLRLDGSLIFSTNPAARWSLFTGIGVTAGVSLNAQTEISYRESYRTVFNYGGSSASNWGSGTRTTETFDNKNGFNASVYVPLAVDFRVGKRSEFWKRIHLMYELRPSLTINSIPELKTFTYTSMQSALGLKVKW